MTRHQIMRRRWLASILVLSFAGAGGAQAETPKGTKATVSPGKAVSIEYTLKVDDKVVDSNVGGEPLTYEHGSGRIIPGLEKALEGMKKGESKHVTVAPKDGYGEHDPQGLQEVKKEMIPAEAKVGTMLNGTRPDGRKVMVVVKEIRDKTVLLDFNHPLAGKTLNFDVKILDIKDAPPKESAVPTPKK
jgi:FKBP-type peptidyl-prolyl cis-trans isomerase SlyD